MLYSGFWIANTRSTIFVFGRLGSRCLAILIGWMTVRHQLQVQTTKRQVSVSRYLRYGNTMTTSSLSSRSCGSPKKQRGAAFHWPADGTARARLRLEARKLSIYKEYRTRHGLVWEASSRVRTRRSFFWKKERTSHSQVPKQKSAGILRVTKEYGCQCLGAKRGGSKPPHSYGCCQVVHPRSITCCLDNGCACLP